MRTQSNILHILREEMPNLREEFGVRSLELFGSFVREEQTGKSDIDVLVEFDEIIDLLDFIRLENVLSELLKMKVDLVLKDSLKPRIKSEVLAEAVGI